MRIIFFSILLLISFSAHSSNQTQKSNSGWTDHKVKRVSLDDIVGATESKNFDDIIEATARKQTTKNGSSITLESVVQETVNRNKVGSVLLKRMLGGGLAIGGITALVEGVGWVMEDGTYIKKIKPEDDKENPNTPYLYMNTSSDPSVTGWKPTAELACRDYKPTRTSYNYKYIGLDTINKGCLYQSQPKSPENSPWSKTQVYFGYKHKVNPEYDPNKEPRKIVLTPDLVGDMAVGDYTDPTGEPANDRKTGVWTGVEQAYQHDPNGVGDEIADAIDKKHEDNPEKDAKPKPVPLVFHDGTPNPDAFPVPDVPGAKYPAPDVAPGTEGTTKPDTNPDGTPKTDPDGNPTGTGTFQLPPFCSWATVVCEWLDWTRKDDLPEKEEIDIPELPIEEKKVEVKWQAQCPEPQTIPFTIEGVTAEITILNPEYICAQAPILKPVIIFSATLTGLYILFGYGASRGKDE